jgi:hypothetical protein
LEHEIATLPTYVGLKRHAAGGDPAEPADSSNRFLLQLLEL